MNSGIRRVRRLLSLEKPAISAASTVRPAYDAVPSPKVLAEYTSSQPGMRAR